MYTSIYGYLYGLLETNCENVNGDAAKALSSNAYASCAAIASAGHCGTASEWAGTQGTSILGKEACYNRMG